MKKRLISVLLILMLLFSMLPGTSVFARTADGKTVVAFTSDVHNAKDNKSRDRLLLWIDAVETQIGEIDAMGMCGDMGAASGNGDSWWSWVKAVMDAAESKIGEENVYYTSGNHEFYNGSFASTTNAVKSKYLVDQKAPVPSNENFQLYCLGTDNWDNNSDNYTQEQIDKLTAFLEGIPANDTRPVFVITHYPLHTNSTSSGYGLSGGMSRVTKNAAGVINALNAAASRGKTVIFLWGHNHSLAPNTETHYDHFYAPGTSFNYTASDSVQFNFYYGAAGCMSDDDYNSASASVIGKGLVVTIDPDPSAEYPLRFEYFNKRGQSIYSMQGGYVGDDVEPVVIDDGGQGGGEDPTPSGSSYYEISDGMYYIYSDDDYYLTTTEGETYSNGGGSSNASYNYSGLQGVSDRNEAPMWQFEKAEGTNGYYIKTSDGKYLNATYASNSSGGYDGVLKVDSTSDVWIIVSNGSGGLILKSTNASSGHNAGDKYLSHGNGSNSSTNTFTVRSNNDNNTATKISYEDKDGQTVTPSPSEGGNGGQGGDEPVVVGDGIFQLTDKLESGKRYVIASTNATGSTKILGTSGTAMSAVNATVSVRDGQLVIEDAPESAVWTTSASSAEGKVHLHASGGYLEGYQGEVVVNSGSLKYSDRGWTYTGNQLQHTGGTNTYVVYYSNGFTSTYNDTTEKLYIYVETTSEQPPEPPQPAGAFSLSVSGPATAQTESDVTYTLDLASDEYEVFAAADITLTYDTDHLTLKTKPEGAEESDGTIRLLDFGEDKNIGKEIYSFTFTTKGTGNASVSVTAASFITSDAAASSDMIAATLSVPAVTTEISDAPSGYTYVEPSYTWVKTADGYTVNALKKCNEDTAQNITETVTAVFTETTPAKCEEDGEGNWVATFTKADFSTQFLTEIIPATGHTPAEAVKEKEVPATCETAGSYEEVVYCSACQKEISRVQKSTSALGHDWSEPDVEWAADYSTATASRICGNDPSHVETETVETESAITSRPTCEAEGKTTYTAVFENTAFGTQTKEVVNVPATGHKWSGAVYGWAVDNSTVLAIHTCDVCGSNESERADVTAEISKGATCTEKGETTYTAVFTKQGFETQKKTEANIPALGHDWSEPDIKWAEDYSTATATRTCARDSAHVEAEVVNTTSEVTKEATCVTVGEVTYTAVFKNEAFGTQTKVVAEIDALGHDWSAPIYGWSNNNSTATAIRTCKNDASHVDTEIVSTTSQITKPATCENPGETTWTAVFSKEAFETQIKTEANLPATGHAWQEALWTWTDDYSSATVTYICANDSRHVHTDSATVTSVKVDPTPEIDGTITYTATAADPDGQPVSDIRIVTIPASGYTYSEPSYEWIAIRNETGKIIGYKVIAERKCNEDESRDIFEAAEATYAVIAEPTCETAGEACWTVVFRNTAFDAQTKKEVLAATGHAWGEAVYEWAEDLSTVTATRICANDRTHVESETATVKAEVTKAATCEDKGETTYTAEFENKAFQKQVRTEADIPATGHAWGEAVYEWAEDLSTVTATRICANDRTHVESETAAVKAEVTKAATCEDKGETTYTAEFKNKAFQKQVRTEADIEAKGHVPGEPVKENVIPPTTEEDGRHDEVVYCTVCGKELSRETVIDGALPAALPEFRSQSLVLSGQIGLNFYLDLPVIDGIDYEDSYMEFTIGKTGATTYADFNRNLTNSSGKYFGFTCYVNSLQMADTITATFHYGDGRTVSKEYSVVQYISFFEEHADQFNAKTISLIHAIADYGYFAQHYLAEANHLTLGQNYEEMTKHYSDSFDYASILSAVNAKAFVKTLGTSKVSKATYKLHLDSTTTVDVLLTVPDGTSLTASAAFNGKTYQAVKQSDGRYLVRIPDIAAHQLGDMITVRGNAGGAFTVQVSALSYVRSVLNNASATTTEKNGLASMYSYYNAVLAYRT